MRISVDLRLEPWSGAPPEQIVLRLPAGATVEDVAAAAVDGAAPMEEARDFVLAEIDGMPVPAELWAATPAEGHMTLTLLPRGGRGGLRTVLSLALIVAAPYLAGPAGLGFAAGTVGASLAAAGIAVGGNLVLNQLFPAPTPQLGGAAIGAAPDRSGPEQQIAALAANRERPYGRRSLVLGLMRIEPDLLTKQLAVPAGSNGGADTDLTVVLPGGTEAALAPRLDRTAFLDLGVGRLAYGAESADHVVGTGRVISADAGSLLADSTEIEPYYLIEPGGSLVPPATRGNNLAVPASAAWPLRARAVRTDTDPLSGATVEIDSTRGGTRLLVVVGGVLYDSTSAGALREETTEVTLTGTADGSADVTFDVDLSGDSLTPGFAALEVAAGARDWRIAGGARATTARSRVALDVAGSYWLAPLSDLTNRRLPTTVLAVRLRGAVGAPPRRVLRALVGQRLAVPNANGVWGGAEVSRNPAAVLRAFALGWYDDAERAGGGPAPTGALLDGTGRPSVTIDHDNLARFYTFCEEHDPPLRCDLWLQDESRPAEAMERLIAACGRAEITWVSGKLGVHWAAPDDAAQGLISPANILPGSLSMAWRGGDIPDEIVGTYLNRDTWQPDEERVAVPGRTASVRDRAVRIEGVTDAAAARFHVAAIAAEEAYHRRLVSWRAGRAGAAMTRGSVWLMAADLLSGGVTGRFRSVGEREVRLDRTVRVSARSWLAIDIPGADLHETAVAVSGQSEVTDSLVLVTPLPDIAGDPRDAVWRLYDLDRPPQPMRIVANRPVSEDEFEVLARDEDRRFWTFLDDFRDADITPPDVTIAPSPVVFGSPGRHVWRRPQAWIDAGIVEANVFVTGAGGGAGAGAGFDGVTGYPGPAGQGGGVTYVETGGERRIEVPGAAGGAGQSIRVFNPDNLLYFSIYARSSTSRGGGGGDPVIDRAVVDVSGGPLTIVVGAGGAGGAASTVPPDRRIAWNFLGGVWPPPWEALDAGRGRSGSDGADARVAIFPLIS